MGLGLRKAFLAVLGAGQRGGSSKGAGGSRCWHLGWRWPGCHGAGESACSTREERLAVTRVAFRQLCLESAHKGKVLSCVL